MSAKNDLPVGEPACLPNRFNTNLRQRILVVEDEATIRKLNASVLACSGYEVDTAEDGAAAWEALQQNHYDLVITDNDIPNVTGVELIQKIQGSRRDMPVIMATGSLPDEEIGFNPSLQPAVTLLKPYAFEDLLAAVKAVLRLSADANGRLAPPPNWQHPSLATRLQS